MATITTNTFLDSGTARTAGETWTINGATLTVRTDTRWHAGSPASMTGSLGNITISSTLGGKYAIDGTKVRWLQFDTGSGTVPAIGTTITQGDVSGYLLGVWADYTSAPTAVGAAMPSTGYIKFREVTGGAFSAGALTGIGANALSADVTGWIEVVADESSRVTLSNIGRSMEFTGDWFYLGTTTGSAGQAVQIPTNGGGANSTVSGVQIETAPGSDIFEWFPAQATSNGLTTSTAGTDGRSKIVEYAGGGLIRIGATGAPQIGFVPAAGCRIRIPNILLRNCTTAARATNSAPTSSGARPQIGTSLGYEVKLSKVCSDWYFSFAFANNLEVIDSVFKDAILVSNTLSTYVLNRICVSCPVSYLGNALILTSTANGQVLNSVIHGMTVSSSVVGNFTDCANLTISGTRFITVTTSTAGRANMLFTRCNIVAFNNNMLIATHVTIQNTKNFSISNIDYTDRTVGVTQTGSTFALFDTGDVTNLTIDGLTFGHNGTYANNHLGGRIIQFYGSTSNVVVKNFGTFASPLQSGDATNATILCNALGNEYNIKFQRIFLSRMRNLIQGNTPKISRGILLEHVYGAETLTNQINTPFQDFTLRSCGYGGTTTSTSISGGSHWQTYFTSSTAGRLLWLANSITETSSASNTLSIASATSGFLGTGVLSMKTAGDYIISETPYFVKGFTSFVNTAPTITSTGSYTYEYQIDTGTGYGDWKILNATNLSAEVISPAGFKFKLRITVNTSSTSNTNTLISIQLNSTSSAQSENLYPLSTSTLSFTGLIPGSEVRCYTGSDPATAIEIGGTESSGSTFSFSHSSGGTVGFIRIFALGYQPLSIDPYTYSTSDTSLLIQQVVDRNYVNP